MVPGPHSPRAVLSPRQLEVAQLVATGASTREIAASLALSLRTVETHIAAIFEKLGVHTRAELTALVIANPAERPRTGNVLQGLPPLVGRESELATIAGLSAKHRFVTILGTGGIGKTQAAMRIAAEASTAYPDGVWLVDLLPLTSGDFIVMEVARLMNITLPPGPDALSDLTFRLKAKRALLIFDNCEHLIAPTAAIVSAILRDCAQVRVLATSREPMSVSGEVTFRLPPLDAASAKTLFVERAQAVDQRFSVNANSAVAIDELCRRLDRVPLAIELAAARSNVLSPSDVLARLEHRFSFLEDDRYDVLARHQSLSAVIDWSYDQLEDRDRRLFRRLSVFASHFSLHAAHAVSAIAKNREPLFIDALSSLINKSLVVAEPELGELCYRLLESTRLYARLKLQETGEAHDVILLHLRYLRDSLTAITERAQRWTSEEAVAFFRRNLADIRTALTWALESGEYLAGAELLAATHFLWSVNSIREGIERTEAYLEALDRSHAIVRAQLLARVSELHWRNGNQERSIEAADRAVDIARECGDEATLGEALVASAVHSIMHDRQHSITRLAEAEALTNTTDVTRDECRHLRARLTYTSDDYEQAIPMYRLLNEEAKRVHDIAAQAECTMVLAIIEYRAGRYERAVEIGREGVAVIRGGNEPWALALATSTLSGFLVRTGALDEARRVARESLELYANIDPESPRVGTVLEIIGSAFAAEGDFTRAAALQGRALAIASKPGAVQSRLASDVSERFEGLLRDALADDDLARLRARGATMAAEDAIELANGASLNLGSP